MCTTILLAIFQFYLKVSW